MKREFFIRFHCAVIAAALGLAGCRPDSKPTDSPILRDTQPTNGLSQPGTTSGDDWRRVTSPDGNVSVEFPLAFPATEEVAGGSSGAPEITSFYCSITNKAIILRLSYHKIPPDAVGLKPVQLVGQIVDSMKAQGLTGIVADELGGAVPIYQILAVNESARQFFVIRVAVRDGLIYRAIATSVGGNYSDPIMLRFVRSFQCK